MILERNADFEICLSQLLASLYWLVVKSRQVLVGHYQRGLTAGKVAGVVQSLSSMTGTLCHQA
jgi:hypothetical protein